jgi:hypothetical protein
VDDVAHMVMELVDRDILDKMAQKGIYWVPTMELWHGVGLAYSMDLDSQGEPLDGLLLLTPRTADGWLKAAPLG